ncbi:uncharacterized protein LOC136041162 [Artemia franciscana]|uniref:uncharacterized protein LOC136041162 n=1 Tax=Artemia franciscana TaxID=6661 RepID=UPI0032DB0D6E
MQISSESQCTDSEEDSLRIGSSPERRLDDEDVDVPGVHLLVLLQKKQGSGQNSQKKIYEQNFVEKWIEKNWIEKRVSKKSKKMTSVPYCKFCLKYVYCGKSELTKHALTKQHIKANSEIETKSGSIEKLLTVGSHSKEIEQRICIFLAEYNLPLRLADSLIPLLRKLFPKDQALAGVTLGKQKATNILRQNFSLVLQKQLVELLKTTFFSVIIDETTDNTIDKQLVIMVLFFSEKDLKLHVEALDMVKCSDGSAEGLTNRIKQVIEENSIPWQNIVGFCADTTNVMFGANRSASTLMKAMVPHILNVKCSCHLIHLCSSYACLSLPKTFEDLARNIYAHFFRSASRREKFTEFLKIFRYEAHRILAPGQIRWLSLQACVKRLIEQRVAIIQYFVETTFEDPTATNDLRIHGLLSWPLQRIQYSFSIRTPTSSLSEA